MDLQYISDADGRQTAVVIPIEEWKSLTETYAGLKTLEVKKLNFQKSMQENYLRKLQKNFKIMYLKVVKNGVLAVFN